MKIHIDKIRKKIKYIKWWRVFLIILLAIVFSWPLLPDNRPFPIKANIGLSILSSSTGEPNSPDELLIQGIGDSLGGKDFFSTLFKIKTYSMPGELCVSNGNKILNGNEEIKPSYDEAGAMSFKYRKLDDNSSDSIYVKLGEKECKIFPTEGVILDHEVEINNPAHLEIRLQGNLIYSEPHVGVNLSGHYQVKWQTSVFLRNLTLYLFAELILLASIITVWKNFLFNQNKKIDTSENKRNWRSKSTNREKTTDNPRFLRKDKFGEKDF